MARASKKKKKIMDVKTHYNVRPYRSLVATTTLFLHLKRKELELFWPISRAIQHPTQAKQFYLLIAYDAVRSNAEEPLAHKLPAQIKYWRKITIIVTRTTLPITWLWLKHFATQPYFIQKKSFLPYGPYLTRFHYSQHFIASQQLSLSPPCGLSRPPQ